MNSVILQQIPFSEDSFSSIDYFTNELKILEDEEFREEQNPHVY